MLFRSLYCMLAEFNHQRISPNLSEEEYKKVVHFTKHIGGPINSYKQYQKWGSVASPLYTLGVSALNWSFWYVVFFLLGGHAIAKGILVRYKEERQIKELDPMFHHFIQEYLHRFVQKVNDL